MYSHSIRIEDSLVYIKEQTNSCPTGIGIILGTGLGGLVRDVNIKYKLDYKDIPHFPVSTVESHHGNLPLLCRADFIITKVIRCRK